MNKQRNSNYRASTKVKRKRKTRTGKSGLILCDLFPKSSLSNNVLTHLDPTPTELKTCVTNMDAQQNNDEFGDESSESILIEDRVKKLLDIGNDVERRNIFNNAEQNLPKDPIRRSIITRTLNYKMTMISSTPMLKQRGNVFSTDSSLNISPIHVDVDANIDNEVQNRQGQGEPKTTEQDIVIVDSSDNDLDATKESNKLKLYKTRGMRKHLTNDSQQQNKKIFLGKEKDGELNSKIGMESAAKDDNSLKTKKEYITKRKSPSRIKNDKSENKLKSESKINDIGFKQSKDERCARSTTKKISVGITNSECSKNNKSISMMLRSMNVTEKSINKNASCPVPKGRQSLPLTPIKEANDNHFDIAEKLLTSTKTTKGSHEPNSRNDHSTSLSEESLNNKKMIAGQTPTSSNDVIKSPQQKIYACTKSPKPSMTTNLSVQLEKLVPEIQQNHFSNQNVKLTEERHSKIPILRSRSKSRENVEKKDPIPKAQSSRTIHFPSMEISSCEDKKIPPKPAPRRKKLKRNETSTSQSINGNNPEHNTSSTNNLKTDEEIPSRVVKDIGTSINVESVSHKVAHSEQNGPVKCLKDTSTSTYPGNINSDKLFTDSSESSELDKKEKCQQFDKLISRLETHHKQVQTSLKIISDTSLKNTSSNDICIKTQTQTKELDNTNIDKVSDSEQSSGNSDQSSILQDFEKIRNRLHGDSEIEEENRLFASLPSNDQEYFTSSDDENELCPETSNNVPWRFEPPLPRNSNRFSVKLNFIKSTDKISAGKQVANDSSEIVTEIKRKRQYYTRESQRINTAECAKSVDRRQLSSDTVFCCSHGKDTDAEETSDEVFNIEADISSDEPTLTDDLIDKNIAKSPMKLNVEKEKGHLVYTPRRSKQRNNHPDLQKSVGSTDEQTNRKILTRPRHRLTASLDSSTLARESAKHTPGTQKPSVNNNSDENNTTTKNKKKSCARKIKTIPSEVSPADNNVPLEHVANDSAIPEITPLQNEQIPNVNKHNSKTRNRIKEKQSLERSQFKHRGVEEDSTVHEVEPRIEIEHPTEEALENQIGTREVKLPDNTVRKKQTKAVEISGIEDFQPIVPNYTGVPTTDDVSRQNVLPEENIIGEVNEKTPTKHLRHNDYFSSRSTRKQPVKIANNPQEEPVFKIPKTNPRKQNQKRATKVADETPLPNEAPSTGIRKSSRSRKQPVHRYEIYTCDTSSGVDSRASETTKKSQKKIARGSAENKAHSPRKSTLKRVSLKSPSKSTLKRVSSKSSSKSTLKRVSSKSSSKKILKRVSSNSPLNRSRSPNKRSRSPYKRSRLPKERSKSSLRQSTSPPKGSTSPLKRSKSPSKESKSPSKVTKLKEIRVDQIPSSNDGTEQLEICISRDSEDNYLRLPGTSDSTSSSVHQDTMQTSILNRNTMDEIYQHSTNESVVKRNHRLKVECVLCEPVSSSTANLEENHAAGIAPDGLEKTQGLKGTRKSPRYARTSRANIVKPKPSSKCMKSTKKSVVTDADESRHYETHEMLNSQIDLTSSEGGFVLCGNNYTPKLSQLDGTCNTPISYINQDTVRESASKPADEKHLHTTRGSRVTKNYKKNTDRMTETVSKMLNKTSVTPEGKFMRGEFINIMLNQENVRLKYVENDPKLVSNKDDMQAVNGSTTGFLKIEPGGMKPPYTAKKHSLWFFVMQGNGEIRVHNRTCKIKPFSRFNVPLGIEYCIMNENEEESLLLGYVKMIGANIES